MANSAQSSDTKAGGGYVVLLLSLNLILLAFFILLNALSQFETQKTFAVLDSVNRAFRGPVETPRDAKSVSASLGVLTLPRDLTNEIGSLFESFVPSATVTQTSRANVMTVELSADELFKQGSQELRPERKILIRRVARALMRDSDGVMKYELAFEHGMGGASPRALDQDTARFARRGDTMARYLIRQAIPTTALSIGLRPGAPDKVRFVLRVRTDAVPLAPPGESAAAEKPAGGRIEP